ncbi:MAG: hypothetical protein ACFFCD_10675 [Promethearchaeota archaeon]
MNGAICPKCGCECASRFLIIHGDNGREIFEEYFCEECDETIRRLKIIITEAIPVLHEL